jgi:hypothetical protein
MNKVAIFVEGLTEISLIRHLINHRFAASRFLVDVICLKQKGYLQIQDNDDFQNIDFYFLIVEAPSVADILSLIKENAQNLLNRKGFQKVVGLRDLSPNRRIEKSDLLLGIAQFLSTIPEHDRISIILAVMSTEAWFLCDFNFFYRINSRLTTRYIIQNVGIDLANVDPEAIDKPAKIIDTTLRLVGKRYRKHKNEIEEIVGAIDYPYLFSCTGKVDSFFRFLRELDIS